MAALQYNTKSARDRSRRPEHFKNKISLGVYRPRISPVKQIGESGPGGLAARIIGPVAIEPGDAPFDALAEAGKAAVLDDRVVHGAHLAVAQHHVAAAITARN